MEIVLTDLIESFEGVVCPNSTNLTGIFSMLFKNDTLVFVTSYIRECMNNDTERHAYRLCSLRIYMVNKLAICHHGKPGHRTLQDASDTDLAFHTINILLKLAQP